MLVLLSPNTKDGVGGGVGVGVGVAVCAMTVSKKN